MKVIIKIVFFVLISAGISCTSSHTDEKTEPPAENADSVVSSVPADTVKPAPALVFFQQDNCDNSEKGEKLISKALHSDTLSVSITAIRDCGTKYAGSFRLSNDTLDLIISQVPRLIRHKNGKTDTVYESQDCYCIYKFSFGFSHINALPDVITLNGGKFRGVFKGL